jgi:hypothetical protein
MMGKRMNLQQKALEVIEALVSDDLILDLEMQQAGLGCDRPIIAEPTLSLYKKCSAIYRFAHSCNPDHCCKEVHEDWRNELQKTYKSFKRHGVL